MSRKNRRQENNPAAGSEPEIEAAPAALETEGEASTHTVVPLFADAPMEAPHPGAGAALCTEGDLTIAEGATILPPIYAGGAIRIGPGAIVGAVTVRKDATLGARSRIEGALIVDGSLHWGLGAHAASVTAHGPLVTEDGLKRATSVVARKGLRSLEIDDRKEVS